MSVAQAAPRLNADSSTVRRYITKGLSHYPGDTNRLKLQAFKSAGAWMIAAAALATFKRERKRLGL